MIRRAIIEEDGRLIAVREHESEEDPLVEDEAPIDPGDLPLDGTYRWDGDRGAFLPLGYGRKVIPARGPSPETFIIHQLIQVLLRAGIELPKETRDWAEWYVLNQQAQDERAIFAQRHKRGRVQ